MDNMFKNAVTKKKKKRIAGKYRKFLYFLWPVSNRNDYRHGENREKADYIKGWFRLFNYVLCRVLASFRNFCSVITPLPNMCGASPIFSVACGLFLLFRIPIWVYLIGFGSIHIALITCQFITGFFHPEAGPTQSSQRNVMRSRGRCRLW